MNASVPQPPEGQLHLRQEQSMKGSRLQEKRSGKRRIRKISLRVFSFCFKFHDYGAEELCGGQSGFFLSSSMDSSSSQTPGLLSSLASWSSLWGQRGYRGITVLYERTAAEGRMVFMPPGRSHLPDVKPSTAMGFIAVFCN